MTNVPTVTPGRIPRAASDSERVDALAAVVEDLAGKFTLQPLLERILRRSVELLDGDAGSICTVDEAAGVYRKEADFGIACQSGHVFPLSEGVTGAVVSRRGPVVFADYAHVPGGHVRVEDRVSLRGVLGVPIVWRDSVVGACVVFSRDPARSFSAKDSELLEIFAKHAAIAITNARLYEEAERRARAEATTLERDRLVREVHDTVAQGLASVIVHLESASQSLNRRDDASCAVGLAREAAVKALAETRRTVLGLAPSPLEGRSLEEALELELHWAGRAGQLDGRLVVAGEARPLRPEVAHDLFRIAQEALSNAVQHSAARTVRLGVVYEHRGVVLLVQDDGRGFDPRVAGAAGGLADLGLRGMGERARLLGGSFEVDSVDGWGTRVRATLPYEPTERARVPGERLRVLVVAASPVVRAGVVRLLGLDPDLQVVGEMSTAQGALDACRLLEPDVVLVDLRLSDVKIADYIRQLKAEPSAVVVVALSAEPGDPLVTEALRAGAHGCLGPDAHAAELARAVRAAASGSAVLSGSALDGLHARLNDDQAGLTEREREVRALVEMGTPDRQIADQLVISVKTVEKHVGSILRKTGARNRTELAALARSGAARW